jgi:hypothetical protein
VDRNLNYPNLLIPNLNRVVKSADSQFLELGLRLNLLKLSDFVEWLRAELIPLEESLGSQLANLGYTQEEFYSTFASEIKQYNQTRIIDFPPSEDALAAITSLSRLRAKTEQYNSVILEIEQQQLQAVAIFYTEQQSPNFFFKDERGQQAYIQAQTLFTIAVGDIAGGANLSLIQSKQNQGLHWLLIEYLNNNTEHYIPAISILDMLIVQEGGLN